MDAVNFLRERERMFLSGAATPTIGLEDEFAPAEVVEIVKKWSEEHPRKTRQSEFLKQWPNARISADDKTLGINPCQLDSTFVERSGKCVNGNCYACRTKYWMEEV